jgi:signal transduction histidine kinase
MPKTLNRKNQFRFRLLTWALAIGVIVTTVGTIFVGTRFADLYDTVSTQFGLQDATATDPVTSAVEVLLAEKVLYTAMVASQRYHEQLIDKDEYEETLGAVDSIFFHFESTVPVGSRHASLESYRPAIDATTEYRRQLRLFSAKPDDAQMEQMFAAYEEAILNWGLFQTDTVTRGNLWTLRPVIDSALKTMAVLTLFSIVLLWVLMYAGRSLVNSQISRLEQIDLMLASIAHDLRSPLQSINNASTLLSKSGVDEVKRRKLTNIISTCLGCVRHPVFIIKKR